MKILSAVLLACAMPCGGAERQAEPDPGASDTKTYAFSSLKDATDAGILAFFAGKERPGSFGEPADAVATGLPPGFWDMDPKAAALAFADANRTPSHRQRWKLAVEEFGGVAPPKSGWWLHDWTSSGCYSLSKHSFALRFGVKEPVLIATDYNSHGVVGANPLADIPGHSARLIHLEEKEARFLADVLFWLDRVRSHDPREERDSVGMMSSTADGFARLDLLADGSAPREIAAGTVWATRSVSARWSAAYSPEVCLNLADHLLAAAFPDRLGKRWKVAPEVKARSLMTPLEERLEARHDASARELLAGQAEAIFGHHAKDAVPAPVLARIVACAGDEALSGLLPALAKLEASLPPPDDEEGEFEVLEGRHRMDGFRAPGDKDPEREKARERYLELREKRRLSHGPTLREPLARAQEKIRIAGSAEGLLEEIECNGELARWSLDRLRRNFPEVWAGHLIAGFRDGNPAERRSVFGTLAAARPKAARELLDLMSPVETRELLNEIVAFLAKHDPAAALRHVPDLMTVVRERKEVFFRRGEAMRLLGRLELEAETSAELIRILLAELKDPQTGGYPGADTVSEALDALSHLPGAERHLDEIAASAGGGYSGFAAGVEALLRLTKDRPDRRERLEAFVRPRLSEHDGMMESVFRTAMALDLRGLAPEIAAMASEGPEVPDGDGANYAGGYFKGPRGQRYHAAREVTAFWSETHPATLGRMWVAFALSRPYEFGVRQDGSEMLSQLRKRAGAGILELPEGSRSATVEAMIAAAPPSPEKDKAAGWLRDLVDGLVPEE